jgi:hypothetical protein
MELDSKTLTPEQRQQFLDDGVVRVPNALPHDAVEAMASRIWAALGRQLGAVRDRPETWPPDGQPQLQQMARAGLFAPVLGAGVRGLLDDFFARREWAQPSPYEPRPLGVRFPTPDRKWNVPTLHWHLDRAESDQSLPVGVADRPWPGCVRLFAYLGVVGARGGGTFYVSGSHRAITLLAAEMRPAQERINSARLVEKLKARSPWVAELCSKGKEDDGRVQRFMEEGADFQGVPLRVAEMTGEPGDVILWHPNLLHTYSPANNASTPRLVLSATIVAEETS